MSIHPRFFDEQFGSAFEAIDYVRGSENLLLTPIPLQIREFDFCDCFASTLGWFAKAMLFEIDPSQAVGDLILHVMNLI